MFITIRQEPITHYAPEFDNTKWAALSLFLSYKRFKLKSRVFSASHCIYGNQLCHKFDNSMFTNDWVILIP